MKILTLTFYLYYLVRASKIKRHVPNSAYPVYKEVPKYDIKLWSSQLHLQICTIVNIGLFMCALFVEIRHPNVREAEIEEYFLGLCDMETLSGWRFCSPELEKQRPEDCNIFSKDFSSASRVHRRLCDVTAISNFANHCNCSITMWGMKLLEVNGFPTCFVPPAPESLCALNVCGWTLCNASTVLGRIHTVKCNPHCIGSQPFCEYPVGRTAEAPRINSFWTDWHEISDDVDEDLEPEVNLLTEEATCINKFTGEEAIDCLGPGTSCCPLDARYCKCGLLVEDGGLKLFRMFKPSPANMQKRFIRETATVKANSSRNRNSTDQQDDAFLANLQNILNGTQKTKVFARAIPIAEDEDDEDDDSEDNSDNSDEDVLIEEENGYTTVEMPEKDEAAENKEKKIQEMAYEANSTDANNNTETGNSTAKNPNGKSASATRRKRWPLMVTILSLFIYCF